MSEFVKRAERILVDEGCLSPDETCRNQPGTEHYCHTCILDEALAAKDATIAELRARLRSTAQILIAEIGAPGPMNAEDAARNAVSTIAELKSKIQQIEGVPVSEDALDMATAFVRRWFGNVVTGTSDHGRDICQEDEDCRCLARLIDAVRKERNLG